MDALQHAYLQRARSAIDLAAGEQGDSNEARATAFVDLAFELLQEKSLGDALPRLMRHANPLVVRAAVAANTTLGAEWTNANIEGLADAYLAEVSAGNLLDAIGKFAMRTPPNRRIMLASGISSNVVAEGAPVAVRHVNLSTSDAHDARKVAAMVVMSQELVKMSGEAGRRLFNQVLETSVNNAVNRAVLDELIDTNTEVLLSIGDPLADLQTALGRASPSRGYVVATSAGIAAALSLSTANRGGMGVTGGTLAPGIEVVAVEGNTEYITVIPASRIVMTDHGLQLKPSGHATVEMRDDPVGNSATPTGASMVSLFQTNSLGLLAMRSFMFERTEPVIRMAYGVREP